LTTNIYIDGFNLYYGALRNTPNRWLNPETLSRLLLPKNTIGEIKYFTALVSARPSDPDQPVRQQLYLRALGTLPRVSIHLGHFLTHEVMMALVVPPGQPQRYAKVIKTEEKGSDVNLATHLLHDAHMGRFDVAVVVSNDSDLLEPIKIVRNELHKQVGILNPHPNPSRALLPHIDFIKQIRAGVLHASQFPATLTDARGIFTKPAAW
jgi:NYN domain-containing protein